MEGCDCPIACKSTSYSPAISYAALSSLSVTRILQKNNTGLGQKFQVANEIRQRVDTENLINIIYHLQTIPRKLKVCINNKLHMYLMLYTHRSRG